jgi:SAM-dependent methyltransferase
MRSPLDLYEQALTGTDVPGPEALGTPGLVNGPGDTMRVRFADGLLSPFPVSRYLGAADPHDRELLAGIAGPVLDVGCGPGRHLHALTAQGVYALGVDISPVAVEYARRGGARAVVGDVFGEVPGAGEWATTLLIDGNIGIGGQPERLLSRLRTLLTPDGTVLAELEAPDSDSRTTLARIESDLEVSHWFPWALVSVTDIGDVAQRAGMDLEATWQCGERWFARLRSPSGG